MKSQILSEDPRPVWTCYLRGVKEPLLIHANTEGEAIAEATKKRKAIDRLIPPHADDDHTWYHDDSDDTTNRHGLYANQVWYPAGATVALEHEFINERDMVLFGGAVTWPVVKITVRLPNSLEGKPTVLEATKRAVDGLMHELGIDREPTHLKKDR